MGKVSLFYPIVLAKVLAAAKNMCISKPFWFKTTSVFYIIKKNKHKVSWS